MSDKGPIIRKHDLLIIEIWRDGEPIDAPWPPWGWVYSSVLPDYSVIITHVVYVRTFWRKLFEFLRLVKK